MSSTMQMPKYRCHKEVWALKIAKIVPTPAADEMSECDGSATLIPTDERYSGIKVSYDFMSKHKPKVGGYYVVYKDGYTSFSPAEPFEDGYTLIVP